MQENKNEFDKANKQPYFRAYEKKEKCFDTDFISNEKEEITKSTK